MKKKVENVQDEIQAEKLRLSEFIAYQGHKNELANKIFVAQHKLSLEIFWTVLTSLALSVGAMLLVLWEVFSK